MIKRYSPLRLMILASLPCVGSYCSLAFAEVPVIAINTNSDITSSPKSLALPATDRQTLLPALVGVFINGQELDSLDVLYDPNIDTAINNKNAQYFLSTDDLSRLTTVSFLPNSKGNNTNNTNNHGYQVNTPLGDTQLAANQVLSYQGQQYLALDTLKQLGITAEYSRQDSAIKLNMGWRPSQNPAPKTNNNAADTLPIDYRPSRAGLLGLSFNSTLSASESNVRQNSTSQNNVQTISRQMYADIGAYGYGLGGVWGIKATGYDDSNADEYININEDKLSNNDGFGQTALDGLTYLPSDWNGWEIDNLYWAKSVEHLATRLGINQPNSLGQGAETSGAEFTGALLAYSNRNIARHLSQFDDDSRSLLQNTSQDYQHLTGIGEAGGVAELRINGRAIARVQIGLDGRYEFLNLDVSQLVLTDTLVEMAIYAYPLARQPLEIRPILLGKRRTNAATDELIIEAGIGRTGNLINNETRYSYNRSGNEDNSQTAAHLYAEYGINNRLAVRGGVNNSIQNLQDDDASVSWHAGANFSPSVYTNADISYARTPVQDLWQGQLQYQHKKLWANYQYQARQYEGISRDTYSQNGNQVDQNAPTALLIDQRHQLLLNYQPSDKTTVNLNQYYDELSYTTVDSDNYYAYTSINHRFSDALNGGINWDSRGDRYGYRLLWQDVYRQRANTEASYGTGTRNTIGLSGDNLSDTLSIRHQLNNNTSLGQSTSLLHGYSKWLYQGDVSYRFDTNDLFGSSTIGTQATDNLINIGYSLYDNQVGWLADWQLTHRNGVSFSLGYKHRYVDAIPSSRYDDLIVGESIIGDGLLLAWTQNNYLYAKLSFDMFKAPKQRLQFGNYPRQNAGSVVVDIDHHADSPIDHESMRFELDNQQVKASLLGTQATHSQYLISNIKAGDYTLSMDAENLPLEYSTGKLLTPRIRVSNYAPTSVPIQLEKSYGVSGKLADAKEGVVIDIYQGATLIQSVTTGSYGYFQTFGLAPNTYRLKAKGYEAVSIEVTDNFVMQLLLQPLQLQKAL